MGTLYRGKDVVGVSYQLLTGEATHIVVVDFVLYSEYD